MYKLALKTVLNFLLKIEFLLMRLMYTLQGEWSLSQFEILSPLIKLI